MTQQGTYTKIAELQIQSSEALKEKKIKGRRSVTALAVSLCLVSTFFGISFTEASLITPSIWYSTNYGLALTQQYVLGPCFSVVPIGQGIGALITFHTIGLLSKRKFLILLNIIALSVTAGLQIGSEATIFLFRIFQGFVSGGFLILIPAYIADIASKEKAPKFRVYPQAGVVCGCLYSYTIGMILTNVFNFQNLPPFTGSQTVPAEQANAFWRIMFTLAMVPCILSLILIVTDFIPQSPVSLLKQNKRHQANEVLVRFYQEEEAKKILDGHEKAIIDLQKVGNPEDKILWTDKGVYLAFQIAICQALTGIASYLTQVGHVITVSLNQNIFGLYIPILAISSQLIGTIMSIHMLSFELKSILIHGGFALAIQNILTGLFFYLYDYDPSFQPYAITMCMLSIMTFMFTFGLTLGSATWPYVNNMVPKRIVVIAQAVNNTFIGITNMCFSFNTYYDSSPFIIIWIYGFITFTFTILNLIFANKIKGKTPGQIQLELMSS